MCGQRQSPCGSSGSHPGVRVSCPSDRSHGPPTPSGESGGCVQPREHAAPAYLDPSTSTLPHGIRHGGSRGVNHGHEPHEAEVGDREVDLVRVKLEAAGKLVFRQVEQAETLRGGDEAA
uniref:Uncharacterized protein n=1 Tax=Laticauda laticaudata TaxID=8630 RepID=A0A8C5SRJ5_LATLA